MDIGSGQADLIEEHLAKDKKIIVSDHHEPAAEGSFHHINPHFNGVDGGESISAAGVTYILSKTVSEENKDLVEYALIGATGDVQKQDGEFLGLNQDLLEEALEEDLIEKRKGLSLYGRSTKPLHKALMYTTDPYLEGITNSETGAIQFLKSLNLDIRDNGGFKSLSDLTEDEEKIVINGLIKEGYNVQDLLQNIYILGNNHGIDEFSTIINACGRLGEPKKGVKILLENDLDLAETISRKYGRKISSALNFVEENTGNDKVVYQDEIGVIDAGSNIDHNFIGTVATISMSNGLFDSPVILGLAEAEKDKIKISSRAKKDAVEDGLNLGQIIGDICEEIDGEGGGHKVAAGAMIPQEEKEKFIDQLNSSVKQEA